MTSQYKPKIIFRGPFLTQSGYGQHCRLILRALRTVEDRIDLYLIATNWGKTNWLVEDNEERRWMDALITKTAIYMQKGNARFDSTIQCTIPNEFEQMAPLNFGVTAGIETDRVSPVWIDKSNMMTRLIVPSKHAADGFKRGASMVKNQQGENVLLELKTPIDIIPYPVDIHEKSVEFTAELDELLKQTEFNYLCVAQWGPRKNVEQTIVGFLEEFAQNETVGLVLKLSLQNNSTMDYEYVQEKIQAILSRFPERKCKVYLLHGMLNENQFASLYQHQRIKALISISYGEGFGLPLFEAAYYGLPIITTTWGGQKDFLKYTKKVDKKTESTFYGAKTEHELKEIGPEAVWQGVLDKGTVWGYPVHDSYKYRLREMKDEYPKYKELANKLKQKTLEKYQKDDIYDQILKSLMLKNDEEKPEEVVTL